MFDNLGLIVSRLSEGLSTTVIAAVGGIALTVVLSVVAGLVSAVELVFFHSMGQLVDWLHEANRQAAKAVLLNAAAYTHTSIALLDAIKAISVPVIEVHLSDPSTREEFRHLSYVGMGAVDWVQGLGARSYSVALEKAAAL